MGVYDSINNFSMNFSDGVENQSGIQEEAYFIPLSWMSTVAKPELGTTAASIVEIPKSHMMANGKKPIPMTPLYKKSGLKASLEGEELSKMFKQGPAEFFIPQVTADILGTAAAIRNYRGIVLIKRPGNDTDFIQIGSQGLAANVTNAEIDLGTGPTGSVGIKITFEACGSVPFYIYKGGLPAAAAATKSS
ncbi:MAG: hypothetical protein U0X71_04790 [Sphingobacteriaceae bacterium]|jgi:hypothetical protein